MKTQFHLPAGPYFLSHSVGRPLRSTQQHFNEHFFAPWQQGQSEPWPQWLGAVQDFTTALARLFNSEARLFCPQVNLSSALSKLVMAHPGLSKAKCKVLMSEQDFPSMGFALQKSLSPDSEIVFIPAGEDVSDIQVWQSHMQADMDMVFISQVYSNSGRQAPVTDIVATAKELSMLSLVDVAQGAGVIPLDLALVQPDFLIGSSVKWLCGGPGAAYLWLSNEQLPSCEPKDVGWFSHANPFEFDIHHFAYHDSALRFWGGTPSVAPYVLAAHSINWFNDFGVDKVRAHNLKLQRQLLDECESLAVSPMSEQHRSGTLILHGGAKQEQMMRELGQHNISVDARHLGARVSFHIYNDEQDVAQLISILKRFI
ncbi:aminotransferase class V-fold PLP-dependent enzyme [Pseudoalteromonas sp. T1lg48]|uniref:aminotransferase class V-fold PLP-dependent enzyme n=1 Tax=Pseudoalteromonas sp. T1lg48 TaxID=2077100 RepID=UPI000CF66DC7|nr:aminotransferase class V-fold PLP-dependent enzyme [Pseudoalteromonas sp. T1lg48]